MSGKQFALTVDLFDTVASLKAKMAERTGKTNFRLMYSGHTLQDTDPASGYTNTLNDYDFKDNCTVSMTFRAKGGF